MSKSFYQGDQNQHRVPQVYLKHFGYQWGNQWKVSVVKRGELFSRQKNVKSFTATTNFFDIPSVNPDIRRVFEELNRDLENVYNTIISEIETRRQLSQESEAWLVQLTANFIARGDFWRDFVDHILRSQSKGNFLKSILWYYIQDELKSQNIDDNAHYKDLMSNSSDNISNYVLMLFIGHLLLRLQHYEIVLLESPSGRPWFTSTNPIVLHNRQKQFEIMGPDSEIYFPLTPKYLAYLHCPMAKDKRNPLRLIDSSRIHVPSAKLQDLIMKHILKNDYEYLIIQGEFKYSTTKEELVNVKNDDWFKDDDNIPY